MEISNIENRGTYAEFRVVGAVDLPGMIEALANVNAHCQRQGLKGALVNLTEASGTLDGLDRFKLAHAALEVWNRDTCLSVLLDAAQTEPGPIGQLVAQNRGFRVRVFTKRESAIGWIETAVG